MKKLIIAVAGLFLFADFSASAQDIILKRDNTLVKAIIEEINDDSIVYHNYDNPSGPLYRVNIENVVKIQFQNGSEQVFGAPQQAPQQNYQQSAPAQNSPYVPGYGTLAGGKLEYSRGDFELNGRELTESELYQLIGADVYENTYEGATKQRNLGKGFIISGSITAGVGLTLYLIGALSSVGTVTHTWYEDSNGNHYGDNYSYDDNLSETAPLMIVGGVLLGVGSTLLSAGIPLAIIGNSRLNWIEKDYNEKHGYASTLKFGATKYGMGLTFNF